MGSGTITQPIVEQERSVSAPASWLRVCQPAVPGSGEAYKRRPREVVERRAEVGGGHTVAMIGVDNTTRRSEGSPARCAAATAKTLWVEELRGPLGSAVNAGGVVECGWSTAWWKAV